MLNYVLWRRPSWIYDQHKCKLRTWPSKYHSNKHWWVVLETGSSKLLLFIGSYVKLCPMVVESWIYNPHNKSKLCKRPSLMYSLGSINFGLFEKKFIKHFPMEFYVGIILNFLEKTPTNNVKNSTINIHAMFPLKWLKY
jgi:hypothetical protein